MTTVTISYSLTDGTLLHGTARGDASAAALKELRSGWRWSPMLGKWYVRGSRNKPADTLLIDLTKEALEEAGFTVEVTGVTEAERQSSIQPHVQTSPRVTPLTVSQRTMQRAENGHLQVHVRPDGDIILDLASGDTQTAVDFIRTLLSKGKAQPELSGSSVLEQLRQSPMELGPQECVVWNYLRDNDTPEGVAVNDIREALNMRTKQMSGTLVRLLKKGFVIRTSHGRWRALDQVEM